MNRYITREQYENCSDKFKTKYQKWWIENCKIQDVFWFNRRNNNDGIIAECINNEMILDITKRNYCDYRIGIPTIETLLEFIKYLTSGSVIYLPTEDIYKFLLDTADELCNEE